MSYFVGVDVGSGSARAGLVSDKGEVIQVASKEIQIWNDGVFYEQSSEDIWSACVYCIKKVITNVPPKSIKGLGFDATCSLVVLDKEEKPLSASLSGDDARNVVMWLDHRASEEADFITQLNHQVLKFVGGKISLEMETPKLLWLKKNLKERCWDQAGMFFDLPDFLTWKATDYDSRSLCSLVCKWTYEVCEDGAIRWNKSYFSEIGLEDLMRDNAKKIGNIVNPPGAPVGNGLSEKAAEELGLPIGTPVGTSIIDAHSGGLGLIGCSVENVDSSFSTRLSLICGTSTCHMAVSEEPVFCEGIWGPYFSAMVPGMWLNEGGQSVTGKLIDFVIDTHPATSKIRAKLDGNMHIQQYLNILLLSMAKSKGHGFVDFLTNDLHIWPDFHGNRSPVADPTLKGAICGLTLSSSEENLALMYLASVQALSYGTRHILETLKSSGYTSFKSILICGGLSKNALFIQSQADIAGLPVVCPEENESVLLGAAILGACAAQHFRSMREAITSMGGSGSVINPNKSVKSYHDKKYAVFLKMLEHQRLYRDLMK